MRAMEEDETLRGWGAKLPACLYSYFAPRVLIPDI